jgi:hypothetical protein
MHTNKFDILKPDKKEQKKLGKEKKKQKGK